MAPVKYWMSRHPIITASARGFNVAHAELQAAQEDLAVVLRAEPGSAVAAELLGSLQSVKTAAHAAEKQRAAGMLA